jgi:L-ascorbate metabolism protein UlaG (beta-lactamase superfamily)
MKITKYRHACFVVEENNQSLVVDPGGWSTDFVVPQNVTVVVITHEHQDHLDTSHLTNIVAKNPDATIYAHADVVAQLGAFKTQTVKSGEEISVDRFKLEFFGGHHAVIAPDIPSIANLGVMVNDHLYYPGDSFVTPDKPVPVLALPVAAPWLKFSEVAHFVTTVRPQTAFPTHDAILSDEGQQLADRMVGSITQKVGARYERLQNGIVTEL